MSVSHYHVGYSTSRDKVVHMIPILSEVAGWGRDQIYTDYSYINWLAVSTPVKNISQVGWLFPMYGKIKNLPNHQPVKLHHHPSSPSICCCICGCIGICCMGGPMGARLFVMRGAQVPQVPQAPIGAGFGGGPTIGPGIGACTSAWGRCLSEKWLEHWLLNGFLNGVEDCFWNVLSSLHSRQIGCLWYNYWSLNHRISCGLKLHRWAQIVFYWVYRCLFVEWTYHREKTTTGHVKGVRTNRRDMNGYWTNCVN